VRHQFIDIPNPVWTSMARSACSVLLRRGLMIIEHSNWT